MFRAGVSVSVRIRVRRCGAKKRRGTPNLQVKKELMISVTNIGHTRSYFQMLVKTVHDQSESDLTTAWVLRVLNDRSSCVS